MVETVRKIMNQLEMNELDQSIKIKWHDPKREAKLKELIENLERLIREEKVSALESEECKTLALYLRKLQESYKGDPEAKSWIDSFPDIKTVYDIDARIDDIVHKMQERLQSRPKVSIVVSMYNKNQKVIEVTDIVFFDSIIKNVPPDVEIILLDDKSPMKKETEELVRKLQDKRNITYIPNSINMGFAGSYNIGMRRATGDIVFMVNTDIRITPGAIESMEEIMGQHPQCGIIGGVFSNAGNYSPQEHPYKIESISLEEMDKIDRYAEDFRRKNNGTQSVKWVIGCLFGIRREVFHKIGYLDENFKFGYHEESEYCLRTRQAGFTCLVDKSSFLYHVGSTTFKTVPVKAVGSFLRNLALFSKKHGVRQTASFVTEWHATRKE